MKTPAFLFAALSLLLPLAGGGAETNEIARGSEAAPRYGFSDYAVSFLWNFGPLLVIGGFLIWAVRQLGIAGWYRRNQAYMDRAQEHMQRQEQLLERIAKSLEERDRNRP